MFGIKVITKGWFDNSIQALKEKPLETIFKLDTQLKAALIDPLVNFNRQRLSEIASELRKFTAWYEDKDMKNKVLEYPPFHLQMQGWIYLLEFIEILSQCQPLKEDWAQISQQSGSVEVLEIIEVKTMLTLKELKEKSGVPKNKLSSIITDLKDRKLIDDRKYGNVKHFCLTPRGFSMIHKYIKT